MQKKPRRARFESDDEEDEEDEQRGGKKGGVGGREARRSDEQRAALTNKEIEQARNADTLCIEAVEISLYTTHRSSNIIYIYILSFL